MSKRNNNKGRGNFSTTRNAPVSAQSQFTNSKPQYRQLKTGINVRHCERIGTINGSVAFTTTAFSINPGLTTTFPWLSGLANQYERYKFKNLQFYYKNKCNTTFLGDISMAIEYDAGDPAPSTSVQMENYEAAVNSAPWLDFTLNNTINRGILYTRFGALSSNLDIKTYDHGTFYVATEAQADTSLCGYLYAVYDVDFTIPQLSYANQALGGRIVGGGTSSAANPLGATPTIDTSAVGMSVTATSLVTVNYPGTYTYILTTTGTVITAHSVAASAGGTVTVINDIVPTAQTSGTETGKLVTTTPNVVLTITATATTITAADFYLAAAPASSIS